MEMRMEIKRTKLELHLPFNYFKGDGKSWIAKLDTNEKIESFLECRKNFESRYKGEKIYFLEDNGLYLAHYPYTKTYSLRTIFQVKNGEITIVKQFYGNGFHKNDILNDKDLRKTFMSYLKGGE